MRIQQIHFENLNSLEGQWQIDFSDPAYAAEGIFAISGPTGAGKTTILDAICLALYGRTPRLERVNKSSNEIMSRHTGSCYAEISFVTREGNYICHWSQQRARKRPEGELQPPKHEIADADSGMVLENKLRDVAVKVEQITGMNFKQFTRSMLLAQGGFAAFLQASADERAPILEQITGTEIYSEISVRVHERTREERNRLEVMQAEISGLKVLSAEEEQQLLKDLEVKIAQEKEQQGKLRGGREALAWLDRIDGLEKNIRGLEVQWQEYEERSGAFAADRKRLDQAARAMILEGPYAELQNMRNMENRERKELAKLEEELPRQAQVLEAARQGLNEAIANLHKLKQHRKEEGEKAKQVRAMDLLINQQQGRIKELQTVVGAGEKACAEGQAKIDSSQLQLEKMGREQAVVEQYLNENSRDASLLADYAGINKTFKRLEELQASLQARQLKGQGAIEAVKTLRLAGEESAAVNESNHQALEQQQLRVQNIEEQLRNILQGHDMDWWRDERDRIKERQGKLQVLEGTLKKILQGEANLRDGRQLVQKLAEQQGKLDAVIAQLQDETEIQVREAEHLETQVALLNRIRDLEEERCRLEDGKPCPLCGAVEHPYATGNLPAVDGAAQDLGQARERLQQFNRELLDLRIKKAELDKECQHQSDHVREVEEQLMGELESRGGLYNDLGGQTRELMTPEQVETQVIISEESFKMYTQQIKTLTALQQSAKEMGTAYEQCRAAALESDKMLQQATLEQLQAEREQERLAGEIKDLQAEAGQLQAEAVKEVEPYGIVSLPVEQLPAIKKALEKRRQDWEQQQAEKVRLERATSQVQNQMVRDEDWLKARQSTLNEDKENLQQQQERFRSQQAARLELYGERDPDQEEARLDEQITAGEAVLDGEREMVEQQERLQEISRERQKNLAGSTQKRAPQLQGLEQSFAGQIEQAGFVSEADYCQARLPAKERQLLSEQAEKLKKEETELQTRLMDECQRLNQERDRNITDQPRDVWEETQPQCEQAIKTLQEEIGADKKTLQDSRDTQQQVQLLRKEYEAQQRGLGIWETLHRLIGSADGKKFRNYAQGLTFAIMINNANQQLQKMSDRYLLVRNPDQPLELNVIDNYQAGEMRSTVNLSGGESFLVSLALALGLSQMASHKVSVDSLFLDEGFGSLDEDTLDNALNTLAGLQQDGKLIGVISHIPALQERINTHIEVIPQSGGRSILKGPAVWGSKS